MDDTSGLAHYDWVHSERTLASRASKLEVELREVDCERKAVSARLGNKAAKIKTEMQEVIRDREAANRTHDETLEAMKSRRVERDRTGDHGTDIVGYDSNEPIDFRYAKREDNARRVYLKIEKQAAVN